MIRYGLVVGAGISFLGALGCAGGVNAGEGKHTMLRVAVDAESDDAGDCDDDGAGGGGGTIKETNDIGDATTWMLYGVDDGAGGEPRLDDGDDVYTGTHDGSDYTFNGKHTVVDDEDDFRTSESFTTTITMTASGSSVTGTIKRVDKLSCTGDCDFIKGGQCTRTRKFFGVVVDGADAPMVDD